jgi:hypothetical protein
MLKPGGRRPPGLSVELVDGTDGEAKAQRSGHLQEGELLHVTLDMPFGMRALAEDDDVTDAIAAWRHSRALEHNRSFDDQDRLVHVVIPVELAPGAGPNQGPRSAACTGRNRGRACLGISFDNPRWFDGRRFQIDIAMTGFNERERHQTPRENWRGVSDDPHLFRQTILRQ